MLIWAVVIIHPLLQVSRMLNTPNAQMPNAYFKLFAALSPRFLGCWICPIFGLMLILC